MRSDYLDTSNPHRLRAFFKYTDAANMAALELAKREVFIKTLSPDAQVKQSFAFAMIDKVRFNAVVAALNLFNGGEFIIVPDF